MKYVVEIEDKLLKKIYGDITQDEFNRLCSEAIASKLFTDQLVPLQSQNQKEVGER